MAFVRKATLNDSQIIATLLFLAMEDIVYMFICAEDPEEAREFLLHFVEKENNQYSYQNCWVIEDNMNVLAVINLYDGTLLQEKRQPVIDYIRNKYNKDFNPEDETRAGEYYIDSFGVNPDHQRKGIGTKLLQFVINEYVMRRGQTLGLLVDETNPNAKRLYLKLGFKSAGRKILFDKHMEHLQISG
jgi:ribosomal protein S18 acetylase RimI-like enzyme